MNPTHQRLQHHFFLILLLAVTAIMFFIFLPFFSPLILALCFAPLFRPVYERINKNIGKKPTIAAAITVCVILVVIAVPVVLISGMLFNQASDVYQSITLSGGSEGVVHSITSNIEEFLRRFNPEISLNIAQYVEGVLRWVLGNLGSFFSGFFNVVIGLVVMILALFYLLRDGDRLKKAFIRLSPLSDDYDEQILSKMELAINSVVKGSLIVALVQGSLATIGMAIFGIPNALVWGIGALIASLIPGIGTALILIPAALYLFYAGSSAAAVGLLIWAAVVVGLSDNVLTPYLLNKGIKVHPFLILISVLGAIIFFGPIGFILGPLMLALFFALLDIYPLILK